MLIVIRIIIALLAVIHLYIMFFEMFAWETRGVKVFKSFPSDLFASTKALAANMGIYNGFLAAGLIWTFFIDDVIWQTNISVFFLLCVVIAGVVGALTAEKKIFFVQACPALIALILIFI